MPTFIFFVILCAMSWCEVCQRSSSKPEGQVCGQDLYGYSCKTCRHSTQCPVLSSEPTKCNVCGSKNIATFKAKNGCFGRLKDIWPTRGVVD